jgi:hypothetical protein
LPLDSCTTSAEETCVKPHLALAVAIHQMMVEQTEAVGRRAPTATLPPALHKKHMNEDKRILRILNVEST